MKPFSFLFSILLLTSTLNATIRTVCNNPAGVAQFNEIQDAINASAQGDTVLVQGSLTAYANFTVSKRVTIIGPGMKPLRNSVPQNALTAKVQNLTLKAGSDGSEIQGLEFASGSYSFIVDTVSINNIRILRNHIAYPLTIGGNETSKTYSGYVIEGNWFDGMTIVAGRNCTYNNFIVQNNVFFDSRITYFKNSINVLINHNLFYKGGNAESYYPFYNNNGCCYSGVYSQNLDIQNNIFINANLLYEPPGQNCTGSCNIIGFVYFHSLRYCTFKNNITYRCTDNPWLASYGNTDAGGNINNQSPQIADLTTMLLTTPAANQPTLNFTIATGPANNSGTDGKDMGLLFDNTGSLNWNNSLMSRIPYVYNFTIANPNIAPGGQVQLSVEARRNN